MNPLIVYLDSQDFIHLASKAPPPGYAEVLSYLTSQVQAKRVVIPNSFLIMVEVVRAASGPVSLEDRRRKGRIIKQLCHDWVFVHPLDLKSQPVLRDDGVWIPREAVERLDETSLRDDFISFAREKLKTDGFNRKARRRIESSGSLERWLAKNAMKIPVEKIEFPFPIPKRIVSDKLLQAALLSAEKNKQLNDELVRWTFDPVEFADIYYDWHGAEDFINRYMAPGFSRMRQGLEVSRAKFGLYRKTQELQSSLQKSYKAGLVSAGLDGRQAALVARERYPSIPDMTFDTVDFSDDLFDSSRTQHILPYMVAKIKGHSEVRNSDFVDLLHLTYAQDCDLIRCDKAMADITKTVGSVSSKTVSRFVDLPARIESLSAAKASKLQA